LDWHAGPAADLVGITWPDVRWHCLTPQGSLGYPPGFKFSRMDINKEAAPDEDGELIIASPQTHLRLTEEETTLTTQSDEARARAEASFRKEERAKDGAKPMTEYQANAQMVRERTERLKALRLAKEAADKEQGG